MTAAWLSGRVGSVAFELFGQVAAKDTIRSELIGILLIHPGGHEAKHLACGVGLAEVWRRVATPRTDSEQKRARR